MDDIHILNSMGIVNHKTNSFLNSPPLPKLKHTIETGNINGSHLRSSP